MHDPASRLPDYFLPLIEKIKAAKSVILTTHRQSDGDGIGSQLALYHALNKCGKKVRILNVDATPRKYRFLKTDQLIESYLGPHRPLDKTDLALVFDTNDERLLEPLYSELKVKCAGILFVDHHPLLTDGPRPPVGSYVNITAASTGEIVYDIIQRLGIELDAQVARALYASIVFDTQLFRYIRGSARSHAIAAELLRFESKPEEIHRYLFANNSIDKISFLAKALLQIEYLSGGQIAIINLNKEDLSKYNMEWDDSRDVIDFVMNIDSLEAAALFREDATNEFKLSLRSKGRVPVLAIAESLGGGGHLYSAGAFLHGEYQELRKKVADRLIQQLTEKSPRGSTS